jgi:hypothetical protein
MQVKNETRLEKEFKALSNEYLDSPQAFTAVCKAARISTRYATWLVEMLQKSTEDLAATQPFHLMANARSHFIRHKNDAAQLKRLNDRVKNLEHRANLGTAGA